MCRFNLNHCDTSGEVGETFKNREEFSDFLLEKVSRAGSHVQLQGKVAVAIEAIKSSYKNQVNQINQEGFYNFISVTTNISCEQNNSEVTHRDIIKTEKLHIFHWSTISQSE